jgi:hypothetical protein
MKTGWLVVLLVTLASTTATAQSSSNCDSVVKKVSFEDTTGLTPEQRTNLSKLLLGRCFRREDPVVLSEALYHQLRRWGYKHAEVIDPDKGHDIRILDESVHPSPVAVTIDFRLGGTVPTINLKGSLQILDATADTTPVSALSVALYSPSTFAMYRAQPDQSGSFELTGVRPGQYRLEMGMPSRVRTFTVSGREISPAAFELMTEEEGPLRIVLSVRTGALTVDLQGVDDRTRKLVALLAPDDEFLTLHAQITSPVSSGSANFPFTPPGKYLLFIADAEFSNELGTVMKLRESLKERATRVQVVADVSTRVTGSYIDRVAVEQAKRRTAPQD